MMFCPEIAVLHSALSLVEKEAGKESLATLSRTEAVKYVHIIQTAVNEIVEGLQADNEEAGKISWKSKIHNLLLYKVLTSHYTKGEESCSSSVDDARVIDRMDILSGILPSISSSLYFEAVKACNWFELYIEALRNLHEDISTMILQDTIEHICTNEVNEAGMVDEKDIIWMTTLLNHVVSTLVTTSTETDSASHHLSVLSEKYGSLLNVIIINLDRTLSFCPARGQSKLLMSNAATKTVWTPCFAQVAFLFSVLHSGIDDNNDVTVGQWFRRSFMGEVINAKTQQASVKASKFTDLYGKYLRQGFESKTSLDLVLPLINSFQKFLPGERLISLLKELLMITKKNLMMLLAANMDRNSIQDVSTIIVCQSTISEDDKTYGRSVKVPTKYDVVCDFRNLMVFLWQQIKRCKSSSPGLDITANIDIVMENIHQIYPGVSLTDNLDCMSLPVLLWRIDKRQPGYGDGLSTLLWTKRVDIWQTDKVLDTLERNLDLLTDNTLMRMYELLVELINIDSNSEMQKLQQLILTGFCQLSPAKRNEHVEHVYKTYRYWPEVNDNSVCKTDDRHNLQFVQKVNAAMNRLTAGHAQKVELEIQKLSLQNTELILQKLVERSSSNTEQAEIIHKLLTGISRVCVLRTPSAHVTLLHRVLDDYLTTVTLTSKEQRNIQHFISLLLQTQVKFASPTTASQTSLLNAADFVQRTVLPYITLSHLHEENQPITVAFALELAFAIFETVLKHDISLEVIQPITNSVTNISKGSSFDITPSLFCMGQLLNESVVLCDPDKIIATKTLKEKVIYLLRLLTEVSQASPIFQGVDWLAKNITDFDWSVQLLLYETCLTPHEINKVYQDVCSSVLSCHQETDQHFINIFRCAAISDSLLAVTRDFLQTSDICLQYNTLLVILLQMLPNLVPDEWRRCMTLIKYMISRRQLIVTYRSQVSNCLPFINLEGLQDVLSISQILHDVLILLSKSIMGNSSSIISHCVNSYTLTVRTTVLSDVKHMPPESCLLLVVHVFCNVASATCWTPEELHEPASVLMLDLICRIEDLRSSLKKNFTNFYDAQLTTLTKNIQFVTDRDTRTMLEKKLASLL